MAIERAAEGYMDAGTGCSAVPQCQCLFRTCQLHMPQALGLQMSVIVSGLQYRGRVFSDNSESASPTALLRVYA